MQFRAESTEGRALWMAPTRDRLGSGAHGTVFACALQGRDRALKVFEKSTASRLSFWREEAAHARLKGRSCYVVTPLRMERAPRGEAQYATSLMPLARHDAFAWFLGKAAPGGVRRGVYSTDLAGMALHVAAALRDMHAVGVAHRDVKPENIVCMEQPGSPPNGVVWQLTDLGVSSVGVTADPHADIVSTSMSGTAGYWGPEMFPNPSGTHTAGYLVKPLDMWAFGFTLLFLVTGGQRLWKKAAVQDPVFRSFAAATAAPPEREAWGLEDPDDDPAFTRPSHIADDLWDLITACLRLTPRCRISARDAARHPYCLRVFAAREVAATAPPACMAPRGKPPLRGGAPARTGTGATAPAQRLPASPPGMSLGSSMGCPASASGGSGGVALPPAMGGGVTTQVQGSNAMGSWEVCDVPEV